jgi:hypothetical protein
VTAALATLASALGVVAGAAGAVCLACSQTAIAPEVHRIADKPIVALVSKAKWRWGLWLLFVGFVAQLLGVLMTACR